MSFTPKDQEVTVQKLQDCISNIKSWMVTNMLKLNDEKTEVIILGTRQQRKKVNISQLNVNGITVCPTESVRNLGVMFDVDMKMQIKVKSVCSSGYHHLRNIRKIRKTLDKNATETAVHAFVSSRLDSGNALLYGISNKELDKVQRVQNAAARIVTLTQKRDHITPVLKELHWLPCRERIKFKYLCLTYKALHNEGPTYLNELLCEYEPGRKLRSTSEVMLYNPKTKLVTGGDRAFTKAGPELFNMLPDHIKSAPSFDTFRGKLKTYLFKQYYKL